MFKKVAYISIAVKNLEQSVETYQNIFGVKVDRLKTWPQLGFRDARLPLGDLYLDLVEPIRADAPVAKALATRGEGLYLIGMDVDNVAEEARLLKEKGIRLIEAGGTVSLHPASTNGVLVLLREGK